MRITVFSFKKAGEAAAQRGFFLQRWLICHSSSFKTVE